MTYMCVGKRVPPPPLYCAGVWHLLVCWYPRAFSGGATRRRSPPGTWPLSTAPQEGGRGSPHGLPRLCLSGISTFGGGGGVPQRGRLFKLDFPSAKVWVKMLFRWVGLRAKRTPPPSYTQSLRSTQVECSCQRRHSTRTRTAIDDCPVECQRPILRLSPAHRNASFDRSCRPPCRSCRPATRPQKQSAGSPKRCGRFVLLPALPRPRPCLHLRRGPRHHRRHHLHPSSTPSGTSSPSGGAPCAARKVGQSGPVPPRWPRGPQ